MSGSQEDVSSQPLVIVRRRRNTEEAHHGGVWKIAYADFMTAMMAFFLVMWLVNAADKKTIVQVAAYFNPIRLTDRTITPKGLEEMTEDTKTSEKDAKKGRRSKVKDEQKDKHETESDGAEPVGGSASGTAEKRAQSQKEQTLFDNPGDTLDKLADQAKTDQSAPVADPATADAGESDPFDRQNRAFRKAKGALKPEQKPAKTAEAPKAKPASPPPATVPAPQDQEAGKTPIPDTAKAMTNPSPVNAEKKDDKHEDKKEDKVAEKAMAAEKVATELSSAISQVSRKLPHVEVKSTAEGMLISLTDDANFGMFEVGSAKPRPEMVLVMTKVGEILRAENGKIVVRGHTDSRAYKSGNYDNWRLSAARAQMAYYMLVRGGVPEANFLAVEGRADRDPKVPNDTEAAQNRRIDILIRDTPP